MLSYEGKHGRMPAAVVYGKGGKPLLSWRVSILPFIEQEELFKQFHLDEPWDSPHNMQLLPRMPATFAPPPGKIHLMPAHHTVCHVFVGRGAAFEGREGPKVSDDFPDGTASTILIIEAGEPVPWTKPENLEYYPELGSTEGVLLRICLDHAGTLRATGHDLVMVSSGRRLLQVARKESLATFNPDTETQAKLEALLNG